MTKFVPSCLTLIALGACARGERPQPDLRQGVTQTVAAVTDTVAPAVVSAEELRPPPASVPAAAQPRRAAQRTPAAPTPVPVTAKVEPPSAPPPPPPPTAKAGAEIVTTSTKEITSRRNQAGDTFTALVAEAVTDASGREVIPSGATVTYSIVAIREAENKDASGTLVIRPVSVAIGAQSYDLKADVSELQVEKKGRGVTGGDAAKVGAGAAAGAILGQILTKKSGGTVVGGVVGAAVGTAIAVKSADKDLVIPAGARIVLKLTEALVRKN